MRLHLLSAPALIPLCVFALAACGGGEASGTGGSTSSPTTSSSSSTSTSSSSGSGGSTSSSSSGTMPTCELQPPAAYDGTSYDTNAASEVAIATAFNALLKPMKDAEANLTVKPTAAELTALYEAGTPSVESLTTSYYDARIVTLFGVFEATAGNTWTPADPPPATGGKFGNYIFSASGTDLRQSIEKGLFNAAFYNHALTLVGGTVDAKALDRLLAIYGAHPSFPGTSDAAQSTTPDKFMAQYAERRSPKDANDASKPADPTKPGPYFRIKASFIKAQAAIAKGPDCAAERDAAVAAILAEWERTNFATVIYYLNDAAVKLTKEPPTDADLSNGLHGYGEAVAFVHGFRGLPADKRTITDAQIDEILTLLGAPHDAAATSYKLVTDGAAEVPKLQQAITKIATIHGFAAADVETFKTNY